MNILKRLAQQHETRVQNIESLLFELRQRDMTTFDISVHIGFTTSGARQMRTFMHRCGLIAEVGMQQRVRRPSMIYRINCTPAEAVKFCAEMREAGPAFAIPQDEPEQEKTPDSCIYFARDMMRQCPLPAVVEVRRHWMDTCLFGDGPAPSVERAA